MSQRRRSQLPKESNPRQPEGPSKVERVQALLAEGAQLLAAKRPGEALPLLTAAWALAPDNAAAAINLGAAYILQGKHDLAVPVLEAAAQLEPDNAMVWVNLAAAYLGKLPFAAAERQNRAIQAFERALTLDPTAANVHYNLGLIYLERKDHQRAATHFTAALATDPDDRDARYYLDNICQRGE